jgi:hypothetical protein
MMLLTYVPKVYHSNLGQGTNYSYRNIHAVFQVLTAVVMKNIAS